MHVVLVLGQGGSLRLPLRSLELPLRALMARRPGCTVSFGLSGLSHSSLRQLRALMAIAKVRQAGRNGGAAPMHSLYACMPLRSVGLL